MWDRNGRTIRNERCLLSGERYIENNNSLNVLRLEVLNSLIG